MVSKKTIKQVPNFDPTEIDCTKTLDNAVACAVEQTERLRKYLRHAIDPATQQWYKMRMTLTVLQNLILVGHRVGIVNDEQLLKLDPFARYFQDELSRTKPDSVEVGGGETACERWMTSVLPFIEKLQREASRSAGVYPGMAMDIIQSRNQFVRILEGVSAETDCDSVLVEIIDYMKTTGEIVRRFGFGWPPKRGRGREWLDDAVAIKEAEPDLPDSKIAARIGVSASTLSKSKDWQIVRDKIEVIERDSRRG